MQIANKKEIARQRRRARHQIQILHKMRVLHKVFKALEIENSRRNAIIEERHKFGEYKKLQRVFF